MLVSRAGANTVSEIIATRRPSILIPIPFSYLNEQKRNAEWARRFGIVRILKQKDLKAKKLLSEIRSLKKGWKVLVDKPKSKKNMDFSASEKLVDEIERFV